MAAALVAPVLPATRINCTGAPARTFVPGVDLVKVGTGRNTLTVVSTGPALLLPRLESAVALPATAQLLTTPLAGARTVNPRLATAPLARLLTVQKTFVKLALVVPPLVALIKVTFAGKLSVTTRLTAVAGPLLVTEIA